MAEGTFGALTLVMITVSSGRIACPLQKQPQASSGQTAVPGVSASTRQVERGGLEQD